jgi:eukaryotic-like serine/threonine-protein kinase
MSDFHHIQLPQGALLDGRYEVIRLVGLGTMGAIYEACDHQSSGSSARVALKQSTGLSILECERQFDLRALLVHPAIPRIYGYFSQDQAAYLVQELIPGEDLETRLDHEDNFFAEDLVRGWAITLCDMLQYLHTHAYYPMVFRDMKPNNLVIDPEGDIHAVDFGLARVFPSGFFPEPPEQYRFLCQGLAIGTEGYAPPEQYQGISMPQSDLYALGATLHHLLTRRDPRKEPPFTFNLFPPRQLNPKITPAMEKIIMKALATEIGQRYSSAAEMKTALESC